MNRQVVTNKTDMLVNVLLTDGRGYMMDAPHTESPLVLRFVGEVVIRLQVGREVYDSHFKGSWSSTTPSTYSEEKDSWIELGTVPLRYVTETFGSTTFYRLARPTDDVSRLSAVTGKFQCFRIRVPKGTFDVTGAMKATICNVTADSGFSDNDQEVWCKLSKTNILVTEI